MNLQPQGFHGNFQEIRAKQWTFFQNEVIFVQLDELDKFDTLTHAEIGFNYSLTQAQETF